MPGYADNRDTYHAHSVPDQSREGRALAQSPEASNADARGVADARRIPLFVTLLVMLPFGIALWALFLGWTLPSLREGMSWFIDHVLRSGGGHGA